MPIDGTPIVRLCIYTGEVLGGLFLLPSKEADLYPSFTVFNYCKLDHTRGSLIGTELHSDGHRVKSYFKIRSSNKGNSLLKEKTIALRFIKLQ